MPVVSGLSHEPARIIRELVVGIGLGVNPVSANLSPLPWSAFNGVEPSQPDQCLTVYDTDGQSDGRHMIDGNLWYHYGFQVRIRSREKHEGYQKADSVRHTFAEAVYMTPVHVGTSSYLIQCIAKIGGVLYLGQDVSKTKRFLHTVNAITWIDQTA